jgi:citrate/tricarballylate utilization protein
LAAVNELTRESDSSRNLFEDANRQLVICNACRYCEGYCPVFRAIETRRTFNADDVLYLANLCHDCRACYYACMYAPPHEFAINIPQLMAEVRTASYKRWSWPEALANSFERPRVGAWLGIVTAAIVILAGLLLIPPIGLFSKHLGAGAFYRVVPYLAMVIPALALFVYGLAVGVSGAMRAIREAGRVSGGASSPRGIAETLLAGLNLDYLKGGGPGCPYPDERPSGGRRILHSLTVWGFGATFVSTTLAFLYQDVLHWLPPYSLKSAPVLFGSLGGVALLVGTGGLLLAKEESDRAPASAKAYSLDYVFIATLGITALTGMLTLLLRATSAMGIVLVIHLASVASLFVTAPYGKAVHFLYRLVAIARYQAEHPQDSARMVKS